MEGKEGRKMFVKEMMIDDLSLREPYTHSAITDALDQFFVLKFKIENNDLLKKDAQSNIDFYEKELKSKLQRFKSGESLLSLAKGVKTPEAYYLGTGNNMGMGMQNSMGSSYMQPGMGSYMQPGMGSYMQPGMGMHQPYMGSQYGGNYPYGMSGMQGMMPGMQGMMPGMPGMMPGMQGMNAQALMQYKMMEKNQISKKQGLYQEYVTNINEINDLDKKLNEISKNNTDDNDVAKNIKARIQEYEEKNEKILAEVEEALYESVMIKELKKTLADLEVLPTEMVEYEKFKIFFKDILGFDEQDFNACGDNIYVCFSDVYNKAKHFVENHKSKYNIIISNYFKLIDRGIYDQDDEKFVKYMKYLKRKILLSNEMLFDDVIDISEYESERNTDFLFDKDRFAPIPDDFSFSDVPDEDIQRIPANKFNSFKPYQYETFTDNQLRFITPQQFQNFPYQGINALGTRANIPIQSRPANLAMFPTSNPDVFRHIEPSSLTELYMRNPRIELNPEEMKKIDLQKILKSNNQQMITGYLDKVKHSLSPNDIQAILSHDASVDKGLFSKIRVDPSTLRSLNFDKCLRTSVDAFLANIGQNIEYLNDTQLAILANNRIDGVLNQMKRLSLNESFYSNINICPKHRTSNTLSKQISSTACMPLDYASSLMKSMDKDPYNKLYRSLFSQNKNRQLFKSIPWLRADNKPLLVDRLDTDNSKSFNQMSVPSSSRKTMRMASNKPFSRRNSRSSPFSSMGSPMSKYSTQQETPQFASHDEKIRQLIGPQGYPSYEATVVKSKSPTKIIGQLVGGDNTLQEREEVNYDSVLGIIDSNLIEIEEVERMSSGDMKIEDLVESLITETNSQFIDVSDVFPEIENGLSDFTKKTEERLEYINLLTKKASVVQDIFSDTLDNPVLQQFFKDKREKYSLKEFKQISDDYDREVSRLTDTLKKIKKYVETTLSKTADLFAHNKNKEDTIIKYRINDSIDTNNNDVYAKLAEDYNAKINRYVEEVASISIDKLRKKLRNKASDIKAFFAKLRKDIKNRNKSAIERAVEMDEGKNTAGKSLYSKLWDKYTADVNNNEKLIEESQDKLITRIKGHNLDPDIELAISQDDKVVFIIVVFLIRQISLSVTEMLIDNGVVTNLFYSLMVYVAVYIAIMIVIIVIINIDDYKLRILLNFFNLHINSDGIVGHILMMLGLIFISFYFISTILATDKKDKQLTDVEKLKLTYKLELITIISFVGVALTDFYMT